MNETISRGEPLGLLEQVCLDMVAAQETLGDLDARAGDGDLGVTVKLGFDAVRRKLPELASEDIAAVLTKSGMAFNAAAASTFGTLMTTAFLRAGRAVRGKAALELADLVAMLSAAIEGIKERGKASAGEKTMLDAMIPALEQLTTFAEQGRGLGEAVESAATTAEKAAQDTAKMEAKHGRAGWLAARSLGVPDAGAVAIAMMMRSASNHLNEMVK